MSPDARRALEGRFLRLAWPAAAQGLLFTIVFVVDGLMVSRLGSESLAAVGAAGPVLWSFSSLAFALFVSTVALVANRTGAGDVEGAREASGQSLFLAFALGGVGAALCLGLAPLILAPFGLAPAVHATAAAYMRIVGAGMIVSLPSRVLACIFQASGDTRTPLCVTGVGNGINVLGDWLLIFGHWGFPAMGVTGAALATALCRLVECLLFLVLLRRLEAAPGPGHVLRPRLSILRRFLRIGLPSLGEQAVFHAGYQSFSMLVSHLGTTALAAHRICLSIEMLAIMTAEGMAVATGTLTGQILGAGDGDLAAHGIAHARRKAWQLMGAMALLFACFPDLWVGAFAPVPAVGGLATRVLRISALELIPLGIMMVSRGALRGAGDTRSPLWITLVGVWGLRIPLTALFGHVLSWGLVGVWFATAIDWAGRAVLVTRAVASGRWRRALGPSSD